MTTIEPGAQPLACGSDGELRLQDLHGTSGRAHAFYRNQVIETGLVDLNSARLAFRPRGPPIS